MDLNSVRLAFEEHGKGTPLVLIHGFPLNRSIWLPLVPFLKNRARLILPDLRGHGQTPLPEIGISTMRLMAEDIAVLMDQLKIECAIIVGHSMGGYVALSFAQAYPGRVAGLGLISTQAVEDTPERRLARLKQAEEIKHKGMKVLLPMAEKLTANPAQVEPLKTMIAANQPNGAMAALKGMADRPDMLEALADFQFPVLVLAGHADALIPVERSATMAQMLNRGWLVELPEVGHLPMMEAPQKTANSLEELIYDSGLVISG